MKSLTHFIFNITALSLISVSETWATPANTTDSDLAKIKSQLEQQLGILPTNKFIAIDFWASWCGPCKQSFPKYSQFAEKKSEKIEFIGVNVDEEKQDGLAFLKSTPAKFKIYWDPQREIVKKMNVVAIPTLLIFDPTGKLIKTIRGYSQKENSLDGLDKIIQK